MPETPGIFVTSDFKNSYKKITGKSVGILLLLEKNALVSGWKIM
jgi:hypothetical protein